MPDSLIFLKAGAYSGPSAHPTNSSGQSPGAGTDLIFLRGPIPMTGYFMPHIFVPPIPAEPPPIIINHHHRYYLRLSRNLAVLVTDDRGMLRSFASSSVIFCAEAALTATGACSCGTINSNCVSLPHIPCRGLQRRMLLIISPSVTPRQRQIIFP